jgi:protein involved in polysaccharide export with SLBB domain
LRLSSTSGDGLGGGFLDIVSWGAIRTAVVFGAMTLLLSGCEWNDFFNPGEPKIIDPDQKPLVVPILDTLASGIEAPDTAFSDATDIEPGDLIPDVSDYRIGPNDLVNVSIFDLLGEGTGEQVKSVRVTETGSISLPFISPVHASGLTERGLEEAVSKAYEDARLIRNAKVSVTVEEARARTFSIQGNVGNPGEYQITRPDFRMLDAMVTARAPAVSLGVPYAYVIRKPVAPTNAAEPTEQPEQNSNAPVIPPPPSSDQSNPMIPPAAPSEQQPAPAPAPAPTPAPQEQPAPIPAPNPPASQPGDLLAPPPTAPPGPQGRANPAAPGIRPVAMDNALPQESSSIFKFDDVDNPTDQRIIRVPIDQLRQYGELKYNVVIRPGDMIIIPDPVNGVYYFGGHVLRAGVFSLTGTPVTLKQAWIAAGGADDFAFPNRTEIIRRIGSNREVAVRVDLSKILALTEPDIYLKPNDTIFVGTHFIATFLAAGRNSFRITYGFGFLYDRNFYTGANGF